MTETGNPNPSQPTGSPQPDPAPVHRPGRPVLGLVLLGVGAIFLMHQLGLPLTDRWWTVFLLIPAGGLLVAAARFYRAASGWTPAVFGTLLGGGLLMALWAKLFFGGVLHPGLGWHAMAWHGAFFGGHFFVPLILLIVGIALIARRARWQR